MNLQKEKHEAEQKEHEQAQAAEAAEKEEELKSKEQEEIKKAQELNGPVPSMPEDKLKEIAREIHSGSIFTDRHVREYDRSNIQMIFMPLIFMKPTDYYIPESIGMIYGYLKDAGPRSINGYPMLMSMGFLNIEDTEYVWNKVQQIEKMMQDL